jgi:hypothetical protein
MHTAERQSIEELINEFAARADRKAARHLSELFLPTGQLTMAGKVLEGPGSIAAFCQDRFDTNNSTTMTQVTFEQFVDKQSTEVRVNDVHDCFKRDSDGRWRIAHRVISRAISYTSSAC